MACRIVAVVLLSVLTVGCQVPMNGGLSSTYMTPGVDGPGPGVVPGHYQPMSLTVPDIMPPSGPGHTMHRPGFTPTGQTNFPFYPTSQVNFIGVESLQIKYDAKIPGTFDSAPLICPATHDFVHGNIYRLKLLSIPGHPGKELFPTLEIAPPAARTQAFLSHSAIPIEFTDNDFDQVFSGNYITKVVYLPNPEFQGIAMSAVGTLINTQLQPGVDPIVEASKRGAILAVIRMGNKDLATSRQLQQAGTPGYGTGTVYGGGMYPANGTAMPQNMIAGVNIPPYGVPMTKTTTGVPGPPQLPVDGYYGPNHNSVLRTEPIPAPPGVRTYAQPGQPIPNPYVPPAGAPVQMMMPPQQM